MGELKENTTEDGTYNELSVEERSNNDNSLTEEYEDYGVEELGEIIAEDSTFSEENNNENSKEVVVQSTTSVADSQEEYDDYGVEELKENTNEDGTYNELSVEKRNNDDNSLTEEYDDYGVEELGEIIT